MGNLYVVATPIGNLNDLSKRAIDTLNDCDLILAEDTRQTIKLLSHFNIKARLMSYHKFNEEKRIIDIIKIINEGKNIALVSDAGTPCISDPGYVIVKYLRERNMNVIGIPGCSAVIDALSISGIDTSTFSFYGFVPTDNKKKKMLYEQLKTSDIKTKVLYESPKRILKLIKDLKELLPNALLSVHNELTKIHEKCYYGNIKDVYEEMSNYQAVLKGEYVVIIYNEKEKEKDNEDVCIESKIIDVMVKNNCSLKDAVKLLSQCGFKKNDVYKASLNLKQILNNSQ